jgi:hypothetical protein
LILFNFGCYRAFFFVFLFTTASFFICILNDLNKINRVTGTIVYFFHLKYMCHHWTKWSSVYNVLSTLYFPCSQIGFISLKQIF